MKRKILIPIAGICLLALAVFGAYRVDMARMAKEEPVVFGTWGCDYCPPEEAPQGKADGEEPPAGIVQSSTQSIILTTKKTGLRCPN